MARSSRKFPRKRTRCQLQGKSKTVVLAMFGSNQFMVSIAEVKKALQGFLRWIASIAAKIFPLRRRKKVYGHLSALMIVAQTIVCATNPLGRVPACLRVAKTYCIGDRNAIDLCNANRLRQSLYQRTGCRRPGAGAEGRRMRTHI